MKTLTVANTEESGQDNTETSASKSSRVEPESQALSTPKVTREVEPQPSSSKGGQDFIFWSEEPPAKKPKKGTFWVVQ